ncbi:MAG: FtsX-like permease family protein, partial [Muribaculaceae bacterium]|nr:FtsX-like permease family protein [Muribaculaceae bacterium]
MAQYPVGHSQSVEVRGLSLDSVATVRSNLVSSLQQYQLQAQMQGLEAGPWLISDIFDSAGVWLNWLELLDTNVVVILILMGAVGAFTLLSSLFILILERIRMIGILKSLGATNAQITRIFALISCRIVLFGLLIGNALALSLIWLQQRYHIMALDPEAYYLDSVPARIVWWQIAAVNAGVVLLTAAIMLIPSRMIARLSPTSSMRFD